MKKCMMMLAVLLLIMAFAACAAKAPATEPNNTQAETTASGAKADKVTTGSAPTTSPTRYSLRTTSSTDDYGVAGTYTLINGQFEAGETVQLEATVNPGYNFVGWFIGYNCVSAERQYTFTLGEEDTVLEARFNYYTVETGSNSDDYEKAGTYTQLKRSKISVGELVTVEASVNPGYNFEGWFIGDVCVSGDTTYSFTMKAQNVSLEARWSYYTVSTWSGSDDSGVAGNYSKQDDQKVSVGETVTLSASVSKGYNFEGWFIDDVCVSADTTYSFTMKAQNVSLEARWSYYTVLTWSWIDDSGAAGNYTKRDNDKVSVGETVTVSASVNKGYNFEGWYIDGKLICSDREYSFVMKEKSVEIEAVYSSYTLTVECWDNDQGMAGTYPQKQDEKISAGETVSLTATVNDGYNFEGWYIGDVCVCEDLTYEFVMEKSDKTVRAAYSWYYLDVVGLNAYRETDIYLEMENAYTKYEAQRVSAGQTVTLIATPPEGYTFVGWYIGDVCISTETEYTYTMMKDNVRIEAIFTYYTLNVEGYLVTEFWSWDSYSWMALETNMGSYSHYNGQKVRVGDTVTLTAVAKEGYRFVGWKRGDGAVIVSTDATYTFEMGAEDCFLEAIFVKDDFDRL